MGLAVPDDKVAQVNDTEPELIHPYALFWGTRAHMPGDHPKLVEWMQCRGVPAGIGRFAGRLSPEARRLLVAPFNATRTAKLATIYSSEETHDPEEIAISVVPLDDRDALAEYARGDKPVLPWCYRVAPPASSPDVDATLAFCSLLRAAIERRYKVLRGFLDFKDALRFAGGPIDWNDPAVAAHLRSRGLGPRLGRAIIDEGYRLFLISAGHPHVIPYLPIETARGYADPATGMPLSAADALRTIDPYDAAAFGRLLTRCRPPVACRLGRDLFAAIVLGHSPPLSLHVAARAGRPLGTDTWAGDAQRFADVPIDKSCPCDRGIVDAWPAMAQAALEIGRLDGSLG